MVDVLGPGEPLVEQLCIHEKFGDVCDEVRVLFGRLVGWYGLII